MHIIKCFMPMFHSKIKLKIVSPLGFTADGN